MPDTQYEEAKRCPKCKQPGKFLYKEPAPRAANLKRGTMIHFFTCDHEMCPGFEIPWLVQVNPDGTIPPPTNHTKQPKIYQGFGGHDQQAAELIEILKRNAEAETKPGAEIRKP